MEVAVIKTDKDGNITKETQTITGQAEYTPEQGLIEFNGTLVNREEKTITTKKGDKLNQFIFSDEEDERGASLRLETFSPTDDGILSKLMESKEKIHLYYEKITNDYGTRFKIKAIQLPDGTWSVPKAKESWRKGNAVNNRALAMQAAASLFMTNGSTDEAEQEKVLAAVMATAEKMYDWIKDA